MCPLWFQDPKNAEKNGWSLINETNIALEKWYISAKQEMMISTAEKLARN